MRSNRELCNVGRRGSCVAGVVLVCTVLSACSGGSAGPSSGQPPSPTDATSSTAASAPAQWFTEISAQAGLDFVHDTGATGRYMLPEITGSGAAMFDFDNDGDLDILLINGNHSLQDGSASKSTQTMSRLYRQETFGRFVDVTATSGLINDGYGMGAAVGDYDNDGFVDVFVTNYGPARLFHNRGDGTFEDVTVKTKLAIDGWSTSASFADVDRDGFLDLYVARYCTFDAKRACPDAAGRPDYCNPRVYQPQADVLMHNNGDGTFTDISERAGISKTPMHGLGVVSDDFNDDGWPDIYVANDGDANQLWINHHDLTFRDEAVLRGVAFNMHGEPEGSMGIVAADFDGDTNDELFVTNLRGETNRLYRRVGTSFDFSDATGSSGLAAPSLRFTGFGAAAFDVELDGDLDLAIVNGRVIRGEPEPGVRLAPPWLAYAESKLFFVNDGHGGLTMAGPELASFCTTIEVSRGLATGDIDNDGDIDMLVSNTNGPARLYRNDAPRGPGSHWLTIRASDPRLKRDAIGARVSLIRGEHRQMRTIRSDGSYLSASDLRAHFGLGQATKVDRIEIRWPDGVREQFKCELVDQAVELKRGSGVSEP